MVTIDRLFCERVIDKRKPSLKPVNHKSLDKSKLLSQAKDSHQQIILSLQTVMSLHALIFVPLVVPIQCLSKNQNIQLGPLIPYF